MAKPRDGEVAFVLAKLQRLIGRVCANARGGPSIAGWVIAAGPTVSEPG